MSNTLTSIGALGFIGLFLSQLDIQFPLRGAIQQVGQNSIIVWIAIGAFVSASSINKKPLWPWFIAAAGIPIFYFSFAGFMSYGFQEIITLSIFYVAMLRRSPPTLTIYIIYMSAATYIILSLFVSYMAIRYELRAVLWSTTDFSDRLDAVAHLLSSLRLFNPWNFDDLDALMTRLNQGMLVGKVIEYHEIYPELRLFGSGLLLSAFAWIPRFLWPNKPALGGSEMLTANTDYNFSDHATFGAGQVVDFYVNFGAAGVILGFFTLGVVVSIVDRRAGIALRRGDLLTAAAWFATGIALARPLSEVFFLVNTTLATWAIYGALNIFLTRHAGRLQKPHGFSETMISFVDPPRRAGRYSDKSQ
ncbi:hypothetical protein L1787_25065 [Acuticoccus sp. M5D2P5]|uniref:hypothetical protein n=1 Tax=Acuticoccus kalidii TaxID=2910977 RepID=UPI001F3258A1|nr:hypothetical protein [Acuticoccus kalidii]MCF3936666.1 hypothetical protein [Acuticoccus kalidii]